MAVTPKTIYLEPDEEVTSVIDKIRKTEFSEVVLVVPKGASISQSAVNLKLIKRKAEELNKKVSIVTQDKVARNLAEKIGLASAAAAASLGASRITDEPKSETDSPLADTNEVIFNKEPVGEMPAEPGELKVKEGEEEVEETVAPEREKPKAKKDENLMPKFPWKKALIFGGIPLLLLLLLGYIYLPRAKANIYVKSEKKNVSINVTGQKDAALDTDKAILPTQVVESTQESSKKYPATGKKDAGNKATGVLTVFLFTGSSRTWVAGTRVALGSNSALIYKTSNEVSIVAGTPVTVTVQAENSGEQYNGYLNNTFYALNDPDPTVKCTTAMTGGSTKQVTVVSQGDFNAAKDQETKNATDGATTDFNKKSSDLKIIDDTKKTEVISSDSTPDIGVEGSDFTMTVKVKVTALAVNMNDVSALIKSEVNRQLGSSKQIIDDGSKTADFHIDSASLDTGKLTGSVTADAYVAPKLSEDQIKTQLEGLNDTQATNYLKGLDNVVDSKNEYFPPFIRSFPRVKDHVYLSIQVADSSKE